MSGRQPSTTTSRGPAGALLEDVEDDAHPAPVRMARDGRAPAPLHRARRASAGQRGSRTPAARREPGLRVASRTRPDLRPASAMRNGPPVARDDRVLLPAPAQ
jgi:hypothetical protein